MKNFMYKFKEWFKDNIFEAFYSEEYEVYFNQPIMIMRGYLGGTLNPVEFLKPKQTYNTFQVCQGMMLFGLYFDFSYYYTDGKSDLYGEECIKRITNEIEKKNKRRKNKLPIPEFKRVPIYKTLVDWKFSYDRSRNTFWFIVGSLFGIVLMGLI